VPVVSVVNLARSIRELKELGLWIVGADAQAQARRNRRRSTGLSHW